MSVHLASVMEVLSSPAGDGARGPSTVQDVHRPVAGPDTQQL